jgi:hypothetical protein
MSDDLVGAADVATGAIIARAVESDATGMPTQAAGDDAGRSCLNCGATLVGNHCYACGQKATVHRTLHAFGHDFLHSVLHFEGKIFRTLPLLFWRPGDLTRRYIHGERAKFVSPLALFLFSVFLTFAIFNSLMPKSTSLIEDGSNAKAEYEKDRKELLANIAELEADKKQAIAKGRIGYQWMDGEIARHQESLKSLDEGRGKEIRGADVATQKIALEKLQLEKSVTKLEADLTLAKQAGKPTAAIQKDLDDSRMGIEMLDNAAKMMVVGNDDRGEWTFTDLEFYGSDALNAAAKKASKNPQLMFYKIQSNAYKFSWALIPISVPFLWLLFFWRRKFKMFDHAVFVTYSLTFMMLLFTASAILIQFSVTEVIGGLAISLLPPIHMYRQLHQAYETSRFGAFWRMCALTTFALFALILFAALILVLGVTG